MPSHLHLVTANDEDSNLSDIMRDFRGFTSKQIRILLQREKKQVYLEIFKRAASVRNDQQYKLWSEGFHPVALKSPKWIRQKIEYIHANPVRKGFVELPEQWKYSSARNWILDDDQIIKIDKEYFG
jgi:REP element-mobilizing transposase RayT